jgi:hypothetical protein
MDTKSTIRSMAPDTVEFTYNVSRLPVLAVRGDDYQGFRVPNEGHDAQPEVATVTIKGGIFSVSIRGSVVKKDGTRNRQFTTYVGIYGHHEIEMELAQMVADRLGMQMIGRFL